MCCGGEREKGVIAVGTGLKIPLPLLLFASKFSRMLHLLTQARMQTNAGSQRQHVPTPATP